jgi:hypothetical protein
VSEFSSRTVGVLKSEKGSSADAALPQLAGLTVTV